MQPNIQPAAAGKRGKLEIVHVGPNTCLKKLILR